MSDTQYDRLHGTIERLTFRAEETGYTVAQLKVPRERDLVTIVGTFPRIQAGQTLELNGEWRSHPKYGPQFQVSFYRETRPATLAGLEKYLGSGLIEGIGPVTAKRIVAHFGLETLDIIEKDIERLAEVPGIARKRINAIQAAWEQQKAIQEVMLFLQSHGVSTNYAVKIFKQYGAEAIAVVSENPYRLAADVYGIGFATADAIARNLGLAADSDQRLRAGLLYALSVAAEDGHCYLPHHELLDDTIKLLRLPECAPDRDRLNALLHDMALTDELVMQGNGQEFIIYTPPFYRAELNLAERIARLQQCRVEVDRDRVRAWIERFAQRTGMAFSPQQREAVERAATSSLLVLTGGPGTGKTFCTRAIAALWKAMGKRVALASPTGRAAQRLSEVTGGDAKTIHRLLEFDPGSMGFKRHRDRPLDADALIVDEASMIDLFLAHALFKAIPDDAHVLLVGDTDQLPSVGPGSVLRDLIASDRVPVVRLAEVFRQAQTSRIVQNAHAINTGRLPTLEPISDRPQTDCLGLELPDPEAAVQGIRDLMAHVLPRMGFDPTRDVQVLCPMLRGSVGTHHLNAVVQAQINPPHPDRAELKLGGTILRVGDRVIQRVNDYNREVFNGDLGTIARLDPVSREVVVAFGDREVTYDSADLNEIALAWAVTIHKSQGSEYPVTILLLFMQHFPMLTRNLFYTALTRARKLAIVVGERRAISLAVKQVKDRSRYTYLARRIAAAAV